jgi:hypothetical protein
MMPKKKETALEHLKLLCSLLLMWAVTDEVRLPCHVSEYSLIFAFSSRNKSARPFPACKADKAECTLLLVALWPHYDSVTDEC